MWTKLCLIYFVLVFTFKRSTTQIVAPLGDSECCEQEASTRVPCPAGGDLTTASCLEHGCCHDDGGDGTDAPACYARKGSPCGRCKVNVNKRIPCGYWDQSKEFCENLGCCYDKRSFPFCYLAAEGPKTPPPLPQRLEPVFDDSQPPPPNSDYWKAYGPEEKFFNAESGEIMEVYCPTEYDRKRCGHRSVTRDECIDQDCCWNPNLGNPVCFHTHSKAKTNGPVLDAVVQQLATRNKTTENLYNHIDASPVSQFSYGNVSVALECPLVTDVNAQKECQSNSRSLCMEENCCWMNKRCVAPYTHFKQPPMATNLPDQAYLADYWVRSTIEMYVENSTIQVMCHSVRSPVRCGPPGINRTACVDANCCWQPGLSLKEENDIVCTLPVVRENKNTQSDTDQNMAQWGDWQTWSDCTATEEETPLGGTRVRRRDCIAPERKDNGILSCNGAASESMDCRDPNGCILGDWSGWSRWSKCSPACSPGTQKRYRRCAPDEAIDFDPNCDECDDAFIPTEYDQMEERKCNEDSCPKWSEWSEGECTCGVRISIRACDPDHPEIDLLAHDVSCYNRSTACPGECYPKWEMWGPWSPCSLTCAVGTRDRSRICVDADGLETTGCAGDVTDTEQCNSELCHVWSDWTPEGDCEAECEGTALQRTTRTCNNPPDFIASDECTMSYIECNGSKCFGDWEWTPWSECEDTCGPSAMNRTRYCVFKGQIIDDISRCMREETADLLESAPCNEVLCHKWGDWVLEDDCDAPCRSNGSQTKSRPCLDDDKTPLNLGETHDESCYKISVECAGAPTCPPSWSDWSDWSPCSESCTHGVRTKARLCINDDGLEVTGCPGDGIFSESCNEDQCISWGDWEKIGECDAKCEEMGNQKSMRICSDPQGLIPMHEECGIRDLPCNGSRCMGDWAAWSPWSTCEDACSPAVKTRTRQCVFNNAETDDLTRCSREGELENTESTVCNENMCQEWGEWFLQDDCNAPCRGNGSQTNLRACIDSDIGDLAEIHPMFCFMTVEECQGASTCPPEWSDWGNWSDCSESCIPGLRNRERVCRSEFGFEDDGCPGEKFETESCNQNSCHSWGDWELVGDCVAPCEEPGEHASVRLCISPPDFIAKDDSCSRRTVPCDGARCLGDWDTWNTWSSCYDGCGPSHMNRTRHCVFEGEIESDVTRCHRDGDIANQESIPCNENMCHNWAEWILEDDCDAACRATGVQTNSRKCADDLTNENLIAFHDETCYTEKVECFGPPICPPAWSAWGDWSECSDSCSVGQRTRSRTCLTEDGDEVDECDGSLTDTELCNTDLCEEWSSWELSGECDAECESFGTQRSTRTCIVPPDVVRAQSCTERFVPCNGSVCFGDWDQWNEWSECFDSCGPSVMNRTRACILKGEIVDASRCHLEDDIGAVNTQTCNEEMCASWSIWQLEDDCDAPCRGEGAQTSSRYCLEDVTNVVLAEVHSEPCYRMSVRCDGAPTCPPSWGAWGNWSPCSELCTHGVETRSRICLTEDGEEVDECPGDASMSQSCNTDLCREWGEWDPSEPCDADCEEQGQQLNVRLCVNPPDFIDESHTCDRSYFSCTGPRCLGDWDNWSEWTECHDSCSPSTQNRTRQCIFDGEVHNDHTRCHREDDISNLEELACNVDMCQEWDEWVLENDCDAPCRGTGLQSLSRACLNVGEGLSDLAFFHDASCFSTKVACDGAPTCPPAWNEWGDWTPCSQSCAVGETSRYRVCLTENGFEVDECKGASIETKVCNDDLCLEWGDWEDVENCDAECEKPGVQQSRRNCINPPDFIEDNEECQLRYDACTGPRCFGDWDNWSTWSACHDGCGPSTKNRTRYCMYKGEMTNDVTRCHRDGLSSDSETESCNDFLCHTWGDWELEDDCNAPCRGNGSQTKSRKCDDNEVTEEFLEALHERSCYTLTVDCLGAPVCPPTWNEWGEWSSCSESCTNGERSRSRLCLTEDGEEVDECAGEDTQRESCNDNLCLAWGDWESGECDAECESNGTQLVVRLCMFQDQFNDKLDQCNSQSITCTGPRCMGNWNEWSQWSDCFDKCGPSIKNRTRSCIFKGESIDDLTRCVADDDIADTETMTCNEDMCHQWTEWELRDDCDAPCRGTGLQTLSRTCEEVHLPSDLLSVFHNESCYTQQVQCDGLPTCPPAWNEWGNWSECSESCTNGIKTRSRICLTENGEEVNECQGPATETETCNDDLCLEWNEWQIDGDCNADCEMEGNNLFTRVCINPPSLNFDRNDCNSRLVPCTGPRCMGDWSEWSRWSDCHDNCGPSTQNRTRTCVFKGEDTDDLTRCAKLQDETNVETLLCNEFMCHKWGDWELQDDCDAPCRGNGSQTNSRLCEDQDATPDDLSTLHEQSCFRVTVTCLGAPTCPPSWNEWGSWSTCSESCTNGIQTRQRFCFTEDGVEVNECSGLGIETANCNHHLCLEWDEWEVTGECDAPCEMNGTQVSTRICINPVEALDDPNECNTVQYMCLGERCMGDWNEWSAWSECQDRCGPSLKNRTRSCVFKGEITNDLSRCVREGEEDHLETMECNEEMCHTWSEWTSQDDCNAPCRGIGLQTITRSCEDLHMTPDLLTRFHEQSCYQKKGECSGAPTCPPAWNDWSTWSLCSETCSQGSTVRTRLCLTEDGDEVDECDGLSTETTTCNDQLCVQWNEWQIDTTCDAECEAIGTELWTRVCANPFGFGDSNEECHSRFAACNGTRCLGDWDVWSPWTGCNDECSPSFTNRTRQCIFNGNITDDNTRCHRENDIADHESLPCNEGMCQRWDEWNLEDDCNAPCRGIGSQTRSRRCLDGEIAPEDYSTLHNESCYERKVFCLGQPTCPPAWTEWEPWSVCSQSCTPGTRLRQRQCLTETGEPVDECDGLPTQTENCNENLCLEYSEWRTADECNAECEKAGSQLSARVCLNPPDFFGVQNQCNSRSVDCVGSRCLGDWDSWSQWTECHDPCGPSLRNRSRECLYQGKVTDDMSRCHDDITENPDVDIKPCNEFMCRKWGEWELADDCDALCRANGSQTKSRACDDNTSWFLLAAFHEQSCYTTKVDCMGAPTCPPTWNEWGSWSSCSQSCTAGTRQRRRLCLTEDGDEVDECAGGLMETETCNDNLCLEWNEWQIAGDCNAECETNGTQLLTRFCENPVDFDESDICNSRYIACTGPRCMGDWNDWSAWSDCQESCGPGVKKRLRSCIFNGIATDDLSRCHREGSITNEDILPCNELMCRSWGNWTLQDNCDAPCRGTGLQTRSRSCMDGDFTNGDIEFFHDEDCFRVDIECSGTPTCPPTWNDWERWSECSESCTNGNRLRRRQCLTENGELSDECDGLDIETENCNENLCLEWNEWQVAGACDAECEENGTYPSTRTCFDPPDFIDTSSACSSRQVACTGPRCMGAWDDWSPWSDCLDNCSPSFSNRTRVCIFRNNISTDITRCQNNPSEPNIESLSCNEFLCRNWDEWSLEDDCNALCRGIGLQTRTRNCLDEGVTSDDLSSFHEESCYSDRVFCAGSPVCPPTWSNWDNWSQCNESCTVGTRTRIRRCFNETGTEVDECDGSAVDTEVCNDHLCIEWSGWQIAGDCSADCEETGTQLTTRVCINPPDYSHSNDECVSKLELCTGPRCLGDWVSWSAWSSCYDSCSPSTMNRTRHCMYKEEVTDDLTRCLPEGNITMHHAIDCNENMCQTWSNWTLLDDCNAPCRGSGFQTNERRCLDDENMEELVARNHHFTCYSVQVSCLGAPTCPPAWSEWESWSLCSETCSMGTRSRNRQCLTETGEPSDTCIGPAIDLGQCNQDLCLEWEDWQLVSECNAECEQNGTERYSRNCANPPDLVFDRDRCNTKFESCSGERCMGDWNEWSSWSNCREACGPANMNRTRQCVFNSDTTDDLTRCQEDGQLGHWESIACNERMCSQWGEWGLRNDCDAPCRGTGNQTRSRKCVSIPFTEDGLSILHPESCYKFHVPCDGEPTCPPTWSDWAIWSDCSETCSRGVKTRDRHCTSEFGELTTGCPGTSNDVSLCNEDLCVTWDDWEEVGKCDAPCEQNGTQRYERRCVDPANFNSSSTVCNVKHLPCTGDICLGDWGTWGPWSDCEDSCSPSVARRNRDCIVKGERHNEVSRCYRDGEKGSLTQSRVCNQLLCPRWGDWIIKDDCNAPCRGKGVRSRLRNCTLLNNDDSTSGTAVDLNSHDKECYSTDVPCEGAPTCPPEWSTWGNWSTCSQSCSVGLIYRQRLCITEFGEQTDNSDCQGDAREEEPCNTHLCKVWNDWDKALSCDADCEEPGFKWSLRACRDQTIPVETANECFQYKEACMGGPCPGSWGPWSQWSDCQDRCGPSVQNRTRSCYLKGELVDNSRCIEGEPSETSRCNEIFCTNWMRWKEGNCTGICGQKGSYKRERACLLSLTSLVRGDELETTFPGMPEDCYLKKVDCIVECIPQWTLWSEWSSCSTSCAPGEKVRTRECFYNESKTDPKHCNDPRKVILRDVFSPDGASHRAPCNLDMCLTWSQWTGKCSAPCGEPGIQVKRRQCRFAINGENVIADARNQAIAKCSTEQVPCTGECITNWLPWSSWSRCSESCGPGKSMRTRVCHVQGRKVDERLCFKNGDVDESVYQLVRTCNSEVCNSWTSWSGLQCSARCGAAGRRHKRRVCNGTGELRPLTSPLNDLTCFNVIERCTTPVGDVSYSNWLPWTRCTSSCGNGVRRRFRTCKGQSGCRVISTDCRKFGSSNERQTCNLSGCLRFSPWVDGTCSAACGATGNIERTRRCIVGATVPVPIPRQSCFSLSRPCRGSCP